MGEVASLIDLMRALLRFFGLGESAVFPALAFLVLFFMVAIPAGLLAQSRRVVTGQDGMVGERGQAVTDLAPRGRIFVHGEYWNAEASVAVSAGEEIRVVSVDGMLLHVEPVGQGGSI